jgi:AAA domain
MNSTRPTTIQGDSDAAVNELRSLRPNGPWTLAAITAEGGAPEVMTFNGAKDIPAMRDWIAEGNGQKNQYWTLNPTRTRMNRKPAKSDIARFEYAYVECDPLPGESSTDAKRRHRAKLTSMKKPPSTIYDSGNGVVGIWKLKNPVTIASGDVSAVAECEAVNIGLKQELGGKAQGVDDCHNIGRLLRLPHTVNIPNMKKRAAGRVVELAGNVVTFSDRLYSIEELPKAEVALRSDRDAVPFGDAETVDAGDLDNLPISERTKTIITEGEFPGEQKPSRSEWEAEGICAMVRAFIPPEKILGVITNPDFKISERVLARRDGTNRSDEEAAAYGRKEIERLTKMVWSQRRKEIQEDFAEPIETYHLDDLITADKAKRKAGVARFKAISLSAIRDLPPLEYVLQGVIPVNALFELYGKEKSGKTFWAATLGFCIATGTAFFGKATKPGRVLHVIGEGNMKSFGNRVEAWIKDQAQSPAQSKELEERFEKNWCVLPIAVHIDVESQVKDFLEANPGEWTLIIVDTMLRNMVGHISDPKDMSAFVRGCDAIREKTGAAVLVLHHEGKDASKGGMGSMVMNAAVDGVAKFYRKGNARIFSIVVLRDGDDRQPDMAFELKSVLLDLSFDDYGDNEVRSAVLKLTGTQERAVVTLTAAEELLLVIRETSPSKQSKLVTEELSKQQVSKHVKDLRDDGYLEQGGLALTPEGEEYARTIEEFG